jgi:hypothetical protein
VTYSKAKIVFKNDKMPMKSEQTPRVAKRDPTVAFLKIKKILAFLCHFLCASSLADLALGVIAFVVDFEEWIDVG